MICRLERGKVRFWSRNKKDWTEKFPGLVKAIQAFPATTAFLDGEVVILDPAGRTSFQQLQKSMGRISQAKFVYQIFDIIYLDGYSLAPVPLINRKELLQMLFESLSKQSSLRYSDHVEGHGREFFKKACNFGIEGIVSKRADSPYESTRNRNWLKAKCTKRQEFVVAGYTPTEKGLPGFGALILGVYDKGRLLYTGRVGTGFTFKQRTELRKKLDPLLTGIMPFAVRPKDPGLRQAQWTRPVLVAEVEFTEWTADGAVRHPSFQGLRDDKDPADIIRETPAVSD
jgi:bifunctional non-homologous end joining protein LigD